MQLDNRLEACANLVSGRGIAVDVGTDHGYLACYLVLEGISHKSYACDVNELPLKSALATVEKFSLEKKVEVILSNGLEKVEKEGVSDLIIAGMGGELIAEILGAVDWDFSDVNLILQPMTKIPNLRKWLYSKGFEIICETIVKDNFLYTVINAKYCGVRVEIDENTSFLGEIHPTTPLATEYLELLHKRQKRVLEGMIEGKKPQFEIDKISELLAKIEERINGKD